MTLGKSRLASVARRKGVLIAFVLAVPRNRDLGADAIGELDVATRTWGRPACTGSPAV